MFQEAIAMSVAEKVVLITGGARGMGREMVRAFIKEGARVIATDLSWTPTGVSNDDFDFLAEIEGNPNVLTGVMDITLQSHVDEMYNKAIDKFGTVDVVINNGGTRQRDLYLETFGSVAMIDTDISEWQKMFDTHVFGNLRVIKRFAQPMIAQKRGSIINTSSGQLLNAHAAGAGESAFYGTSREGSYQPAKAAMGSMTIYLARELQKDNVAVNLMMPGHTATTGSDEQEVGRRQVRQRMGLGVSNFTPRRVRADNVVPLSLHLAEQEGEGITGRWISCMTWNEENGLGGFETWGVAGDVETARAAGTL
jgi:NAD(P)-dependent dehydrogenase (short-subunit alcohol dehydrogenase family)